MVTEPRADAGHQRATDQRGGDVQMLTAALRRGRRGAGVGQPLQPQQQLQIGIESLAVDPDGTAGQHPAEPAREHPVDHPDHQLETDGGTEPLHRRSIGRRSVRFIRPKRQRVVDTTSMDNGRYTLADDGWPAWQVSQAVGDDSASTWTSTISSPTANRTDVSAGETRRRRSGGRRRSADPGADHARKPWRPGPRAGNRPGPSHCAPTPLRCPSPLTRASASVDATRPYSRPEGSTNTLAANRSPPTWLHSQTRPGRNGSSAAATGRPRIAQQTSWVPCAQTAYSGTVFAAGDGESCHRACRAVP